MSDAPSGQRPPRLIHVLQGEHAVAMDDGSVMTAVLGSCVAACLRDPVARVGGMNHFLLPEARETVSEQVIYGAQAMELLINAMLKLGARKSRLEAKIFGGATMIAGLSDIGHGNAEFAQTFLRDEGIRCLSKSLGGTKARRIRFWPLSGRAQQMLLRGDATLAAPTAPAPSPPPASGNDVELF